MLSTEEIDVPSQAFACTRSTFDDLPLELTGTGTDTRYNINAVPSIAPCHQYRIGGDIGSHIGSFKFSVASRWNSTFDW